MTRLRERESCAWIWVGILGALLWTAPALAQDWATIEDVMDASLESRMEEYGVPGAVMTIIRDGEVIYEGAYGLANAETGVPVLHDATPFRLASISKTFTATAAAQLAAQGALDLDAPITDYLGDAAPPMPLGPVTMRNLLTHTSGFDNTDVGDAAIDAGAIVSLEQYVAEKMTPQTSAPGALYRYSNPGFALAGRVIEVVSGRTYADHMRDALLVPLGMTDSTFAQAGPVEIESRLARGHEAGSFEVFPRDFTQTAPADSLLATGADMGRYMAFQLEAMEQGALRALHARQFSHTDGIIAQMLGWEESMWRGRRVLTHSGGQLGFTSYVALVPEERLGYFIALNARVGTARGAVLGDFLDAFMPRPEGGYGTPEGTSNPSPVGDYVGDYRSLDYPYGNFERLGALLGLFGRTAEVRVDGERLLIDGQPYAEIAPGIFQIDAGWPSIWRFERDDTGAIARAYAGRDAYRRLAIFEGALVLAAALSIAFLAALLRGVVLPLWRMVRRKKAAGAPAVFAASIAIVAGVGGTGAAIANALGGAVQLDYGMPASLTALFAFNGIVVLFAALALPAALWHGRKAGFAAGLRETVFAGLMVPVAFLLPYLGIVQLG